MVVVVVVCGVCVCVCVCVCDCIRLICVVGKLLSFALFAFCTYILTHSPTSHHAFLRICTLEIIFVIVITSLLVIIIFKVTTALAVHLFHGPTTILFCCLSCLLHSSSDGKGGWEIFPVQDENLRASCSHRPFSLQALLVWSNNFQPPFQYCGNSLSQLNFSWIVAHLIKLLTPSNMKDCIQALSLFLMDSPCNTYFSPPFQCQTQKEQGSSPSSHTSWLLPDL